MGSYTILKMGDKLPTVSILQLLLNRQLKGKKIVVDGDFGGGTKKAVIRYQKLRHINPNGTVGRRTWSRLIKGTGIRIVDCLDVTEDWRILLDMKGKIIGNPEYAYKPFNRVGASPILIGDTADGVTAVVNKIIARAGSPATLILLRFYGHGAIGWQGISHGTGNNISYSDELTGLWDKNLEKTKPVIRRLNSHFGIYTSIQLHGCNVARKDKGKSFIQSLATTWGVPVSAATSWQFWGADQYHTFKFEGEVINAFPGGKNLKTWSAGLPQLAENR